MRKRIILLFATCFIVALVGIGGYKSGYRKGYDKGSLDGYKQAVSDYIPPKENVPSVGAYSNEEVFTYILNRNTKKFHKLNCASVSQMKESNKVELTATRTEMIENGYSPCQRCNP